MKVLTVKDAETINVYPFVQKYLDSPIHRFDSQTEMLDFAQQTGRKYIIVVLPDAEPSEPKPERSKGRKTGTYKEPDKSQFAALQRELKRGEYRKKLLCQFVDMSLNTFNVFLSRHEKIESVRVKNQEANRIKSEERLKIEIVDGLQQITMQMK